MTAATVVKRALRILGVLHQGGAPSGQESADGLEALNDMLGAWSLEGYMIPEKKRETFSLTAGKSQYSIGASGDFDTVWPLEIFNCGAILPGNDSEVPVKIITQQEWARIGDKTVTSTYPNMIYYNKAYPLGLIDVWPVPDASTTLVLYSIKQLSTFTGIQSDVDFPPGYKDAICYNLADRLAPEYDRTLNPRDQARADKGLALIQRVNFRPPLMTNDATQLAEGNNRFDYRVGE